MKDKLSDYISRKLEKEGRSLRWMARQIGISNVHLRSLLEGERVWSGKILQKVAKALNLPLLQVYIMAGAITKADLEQYSISQSFGDELTQLLAVPGARNLCHKIRELLSTYPQYRSRIVPSIIRSIDRERAICFMRYTVPAKAKKIESGISCRD